MTIKTVTELVRNRADRHGDRRIYTFLRDGEQEAGHLSLADVDRQSRAIAARLQETTSTGERVLLMYAPGLEFITGFLACLYAGTVAVPAYAPSPTRPERYMPRLSAISANAATRIILTTSDQAGRLQPLLGKFDVFRSARVIEADQVDAAAADDWKPVPTQPDTLALLQYTSGSTSEPKGVMVSHGNILHNLAFIRESEANDADSCSVTWLPSFHDMGLLEGILSPLYGAYPLYLMSPQAFIQRPLRWLRAISKYRATNSGGPNFAYDYCTRAISKEQRDGLDLGSWRVAYNGSEPVHMETMDRFSKAFAACGFRFNAFCPVYGLAESTALAAATRRGSGPSWQAPGHSRKRAVACGEAEGHSRLLVVSPQTRLECQPGHEGEIWLAGPSVAQGYWNDPPETEMVFNARLADGDSGTFLRTGDLGYVLDGKVYITGRIKDLVILRGRKLFPQDIEYTVAHAHPEIRQNGVAAFSVDDGNTEHLVIFAELGVRSTARAGQGENGNRDENRSDHQAVAQALVEAVSLTHEARVSSAWLLPPGGIPRTSSGKIQRFRCREEFLAGRVNALFRWDTANLSAIVPETTTASVDHA